MGLYKTGGDSIAAAIHEWKSEEGLKRLSEFSAMGLTSKQIAEIAGVSERTFESWRRKYPEIEQALRSGEQQADRLVETALLKRAIGYTHTEVVRQLNKDSGELEIIKTVEKDVMPSTTAQIFWLKNKCGYEWDGRCNEEEEGGLVLLPETAEQ